MEAARAPANLADGLRAAQHQHTEGGQLRRRQLEDLTRHVLVLRHAALAPVEDVDEVLPPQRVYRLLDRPLVIVNRGVAVRDLVARVHQRVQRQRVVVGRRQLLLDERADDAHLHLVQKRFRQHEAPEFH